MSKSSGTIYATGTIGAFIYNMQYADSFKEVLWGICKSVFWPAVMVYEVLSRLQA